MPIATCLQVLFIGGMNNVFTAIFIYRITATFWSMPRIPAEQTQGVPALLEDVHEDLCIEDAEGFCKYYVSLCTGKTFFGMLCCPRSHVETTSCCCPCIEQEQERKREQRHATKKRGWEIPIAERRGILALRELLMVWGR